MPDQTAFQEHVLDAPDVCRNCFRLVRSERSRTTSATQRSDVSVEKSPYTRVRRHTEIDHEPDVVATDSIAVWCDCGCQSAYDRYWEDGADRCLTMARFKELLKRCIYSLEGKGVTLDRGACIRQAIGHYRDEHNVNAALERGVELGIRASIGDGRKGKQRASATP